MRADKKEWYAPMPSVLAEEWETYRAVEKQKEFIGILTDYDKDTVTIEMEDETKRTFERSEIALIRLAFDF